MAKRIRKAPSVSEAKDFRALEAFLNEVEDFNRRVGSVTANVGSISAGSVGTVAVTVPDAKIDLGMTVQIGLPSALSSGLVSWANITANGTVTIYLYNYTGSPINPDSGVYSARVTP